MFSKDQVAIIVVFFESLQENTSQLNNVDTTLNTLFLLVWWENESFKNVVNSGFCLEGLEGRASGGDLCPEDIKELNHIALAIKNQ